MKNEDCGFIKLNRKFLDWGWYTDINTKIIFIHMLLKANWKDGVFKDTTVPRGSFVSLIAKLAEETGLTNDEANIEIPKLATGAVLPANREFLALVGDQKHGTNVEAPLDTIRQAQKDAIMEGAEPEQCPVIRRNRGF